MLIAVILALGILSLQNENNRLRLELVKTKEQVSVLELSAKGLEDEINRKQIETEKMLLQIDELTKSVEFLQAILEEEIGNATEEDIEAPATADSQAGSQVSNEPAAISSSEALEKIIQRESRGDPNAYNPSGPYCGIGQLQASYYPKYVGKTWEECAGDYDIQLQAMIAYINDRYGSPEAAWNHILETGWY